ncbi:MAG: outer membrane beta-barrel protein [Acidobacteriia bacterium]|nr:outer membrane beta-barrel protein [Terriglobia bacterium]
MNLLGKACTPAALLLMLASGVSAADPGTWTGFYAGATVGGSFGRMDFSSETAQTVSRSLFDHDANGTLVGLQVGANWQFRKHLVIGFEADHSIARIGETVTQVFGPNGGPGTGNRIDVETDVDYIQTIRGRIGYGAGRNLLFVTGGITGMRHNGSSRATLLSAFAADTDTGFHTGSTVGIGYERKFTDKLSLKAEYLWMMSGNNNYVSDLTAAAAEGGEVDLIGLEYRTNIVRFGVNFHF